MTEFFAFSTHPPNYPLNLSPLYTAHTMPMLGTESEHARRIDEVGFQAVSLQQNKGKSDDF